MQTSAQPPKAASSRRRAGWRTLLAVATLLPTLALAEDFPPDASMPSAEAVKAHLEGKVFNVQIADGSSWRVEYNRGYMYLDTSQGYKTSGPWRAEAGQMCAELKGRPPGCNAVRMREGVMLYQRPSGEIVRFMPK